MKLNINKKISAVIITKNEEVNIERCLKSIQWVDEIIIADSGSTDKTLEICQNHNCRIIETEWLGFGRTRILAVNAASHDWILSIDADEEVTDCLQNKIKNILTNPDYNGYRIKRSSYYLGKLIRFCGWNHDYQLRLFNRNFGNYNKNIVHESVLFKGEIGKIDQPLLHYTYPTIQSHILRMDNYSDLGAEQARLRGKTTTVCGAVVRGFLKFFKMYILQLGLLDGKIGFLLSYNSAFGVYLKYLKLWEKSR
jgi:glycosyltransferase involved in cell wall biosynthesis